MKPQEAEQKRRLIGWLNLCSERGEATGVAVRAPVRANIATYLCGLQYFYVRNRMEMDCHFFVYYSRWTRTGGQRDAAPTAIYVRCTCLRLLHLGRYCFAPIVKPEGSVTLHPLPFICDVLA